MDEDIKRNIEFIAKLDESTIDALTTVLAENASNHLSVIDELSQSGKCSREEAFRLVLQGALKGAAREARGELADLYTKECVDVGLEQPDSPQQETVGIQHEIVLSTYPERVMPPASLPVHSMLEALMEMVTQPKVIIRRSPDEQQQQH